MQVSLEKLSGLENKLNIEIPAADIESKVKTKLTKLATTVKLPGFRPGKVPYNIVQKKYSGSARAEVLDVMIRETYSEAVKEKGLRPAGSPRIEIVSSEPDKNFVYAATFESYPEVKLGDLSQLEVEKIIAEVTDVDIDEMLEKMRKGHAKWDEVTDKTYKAQSGDQLTVDFTFTPEVENKENKAKEEKGVKFVLGDGSMWQEFEKQLAGVCINETKEFTLQLPDTHSDKKLAGKSANFVVKVNKVYRPILPELNDEFAKKLNIEGGLEKLKAEVRKHMERELKSVLQNLIKKSVTDKLLEQNSEIEVPKVMIENELARFKQQWQGQFTHQPGGAKNIPEFPRDNFLEQAKKAATLGVLLSAIINEQQIKVELPEIRKKVESLVGDYYEDAKDMVERCMADQNYMAQINGVLLEEKVLDYLMSKIKMTEKPMSYKDVMAQKSS